MSSPNPHSSSSSDDDDRMRCEELGYR
jgi:hypothetical protein